MKVLLISFVVEPLPFFREEIGLAYIAALTRADGHDVLLLSETEDSIDYARIAEYEPQLIGATVYGMTKRVFYQFAEKVTSLLPECRICVGGYLPTFGAREMMGENARIDFAARGEGERIFLDLVRLLAGGDGLPPPAQLAEIQGLVFRSGGEIIENEERPHIEDLDLLPFPSRDILREHNLKLAQVSTSRGCRLDCTFCVARRFWKEWRGRSTESVLSELREIYQLGVRHFNFVDNSFEDPDTKCERMMKIAQAIVDSGLRISWVADARAELHRKLSPEMVGLLQRSGLRSLYIGIEAANHDDLRLYAKASTKQDVYDCMEFFPRHGIRVRPGFMNFNPYSTLERLRQNIDFLERFGLACDFYRLISRYALESGGRLYARVEADSLLLPGMWDDPFRYRFVDERAGEVYAFLAEIVNRLNEEAGIPSRVQLCETAVLEILHELSTEPAASDDHHRASSVRAVESQYTRFLENLSSSNAALFGQLLDLAERGWSRGNAERVVEAHLRESQLSSEIGELEASAVVLFGPGGIQAPIVDIVLGDALH